MGADNREYHEQTCGPVRGIARALRANAVRSRRALVFDGVMLVLCIGLFFVNDNAIKPAAAAAADLEGIAAAAAYFIQCYFNDFLAGAAFLAYTNLLIDLVRPAVRIRRFATCLGYIFACGLFWEYAAPLFVAGSTPDPFDIVAYVVGAAAYWLCSRVALRGTRERS